MHMYQNYHFVGRMIYMYGDGQQKQEIKIIINTIYLDRFILNKASVAIRISFPINTTIVM